MPVISMVSSKGGVGKTTSAVLLAGELVAAGRRVILIDADPNRPLKMWSCLKSLPENLSVVVDDSADTIIDTIEEARGVAQFVIVDLEGTATDRVGYAVARSDLALIPTQPSVLDAAEAAKAIKLTRQMSRVASRDIPHRVFFSRVPSAIREKTARDLEQQFAASEIPMLGASLVDRAAYRALFSVGGILSDLSKSDVGGIEAATENAGGFTQAVINALRGD